MSKRKIVILMTAEHGLYGLCKPCQDAAHIELETDHIVKVWIHEQARQELMRTGMTSEEASRYMFGYMIQRQEDEAAEPYDTLHICGEHLMMAIEVMTNQTIGVQDKTGDITVHDITRNLYAKFIAGQAPRYLYLFDRNQLEDQTQPTAAVSEEATIPAFIAHYEKSGLESMLPEHIGPGEAMTSFDSLPD